MVKTVSFWFQSIYRMAGNILSSCHSPLHGIVIIQTFFKTIVTPNYLQLQF